MFRYILIYERMAYVSGMSETGGMTGMSEINKMDGIGRMTGSSCMGFKWLKPVYIDMINMCLV